MVSRVLGLRVAGLLLLTMLATLSRADSPRPSQWVRPGEMARKSEWVKARFESPRQNPPFSFVYGGKPSATLLGAWPSHSETAEMAPARTRRTLTWTDAATGLEVRCVVVEYADYPAVEWTVYFKNMGKSATPILERIEGLDTSLDRGAEEPGKFVLHGRKGDTSAADLYEPFERTLNAGTTERFAPVGGRGSNGAFPYYNLEMPPGGGLMIAVGWPGQWASTFARDEGRALHITAGQELTRLVLRPGETVRTPLIALVFWQGDDTAQAQNLWRRWMFAHNVPRTGDGALPPPLLFGNTSGEFNEMTGANEENQNFFIDRYRQERVPINFWWMDAGWYPCEGQWPRTGTWEPDLKRFPRGLRAISDHAEKVGVKTLVWFEPERVAQGTWLAENHPDWLLGKILLNLGRPEVRDWLTDHVDKVLREQRIRLYRQDFNMDPLAYWRKNDAPDREGMTENQHIQNYLAYWDELRRRHPGLIIDSCASGGRRNDLETMRRAIALHPTDYNYAHLAAKQAFHASLFEWLPCFGSNTVPVETVDAYAIRSGHAMNVVLGYDLRRADLDYDLLRKLTAEWRAVVPYYQGDFYRLTGDNRAEERWLAWQFDRPEQADGIVEAFRRSRAVQAAESYRLRGIAPEARYEISDLATGRTSLHDGQELADHGLPLAIGAKPGAAVVRYRRLPETRP